MYVCMYVYSHVIKLVYDPIQLKSTGNLQPHNRSIAAIRVTVSGKMTDSSATEMMMLICLSGMLCEWYVCQSNSCLRVYPKKVKPQNDNTLEKMCLLAIKLGGALCSDQTISKGQWFVVLTHCFLSLIRIYDTPNTFERKMPKRSP